MTNRNRRPRLTTRQAEESRQSVAKRLRLPARLCPLAMGGSHCCHLSLWSTVPTSLNTGHRGDRGDITETPWAPTCCGYWEPLGSWDSHLGLALGLACDLLLSCVTLPSLLFPRVQRSGADGRDLPQSSLPRKNFSKVLSHSELQYLNL